MAKGKVAGITVEIGGDTTNLGKALGSVNTKTRDLQRELKGVETLLKMDPGNVELISQKQEILNETIEQTRKKLDVLKGAQKEVQSQFDKGEITADQYRDFQRELILTEQKLGKLEEQAADFNSTGKKVDKVADGMEDVGDEAKNSGKETSRLGDIIKGNLISGAIIGGLKALSGAFKSVTSTIFGSVEATKEYRQDISRLGQNAKDSGNDLGVMKTELSNLAAITGETDSSVEALSNLMATGFEGDGMTQAVDALSGAMIKFPDTLKIEGLADGLQETIATGEAIGPFAELIDRMGGSTEEFNEAMAGATTEAERQQVALDWLAKSGLAQVNEEYQKNNEQMIAAEEANFKLNDAMAGLATVIEPLQTMLKSGLADILANLVGVLQGNTGASDAFADSINTLATNILDMVVNAIPTLQTVFTTLLPTLIDAIVTALPALTTAAISILQVLVQGIMDNLPQIIAAGLSILMQLTQAMIDNLPLLINAAITLVMMLAKALSDNLPTLIPAAIEAVITIVESLVDNIDMLIDAAIAIMIALANGLINALPRLMEKAPVIIAKLVEALSRNMPKIVEAAVTIVVMLAIGLIKALPQLIAKIPTLIQAIVTAFKNYNWLTIGSAIIDGIKKGIGNAAKGLATAAVNAAKAAFNGMKKFLGIHSPSTKARDELGKMLPQGMAIGIKADTTKAVEAMDDLSMQVMDAGQPEMVNMMNGNPLVSPSTQLESVRSSLGDNGSLAGKIDSMIAILAQYLPHLEDEMQIVMDNGALVGQLAPGINRELGRNSSRRERGI